MSSRNHRPAKSAELTSIALRYCPAADQADIAALVQRTRHDGQIRNPAAYLHAKGKSGDLADELESLRAGREQAEVGRQLDERRQGEACAHGQPGGAERHPSTGMPLCPLCRREVRPSAPDEADAQPEDENASDRPQTPYRLVMTPASGIRPRPVRWGWQDRIPAGAVSLIAGREGIGKSLLLTDLIAKTTRGKLPGMFEGKPRGVIYAATEDSWQHTIVPRLIAAGADLASVFRVEVEHIETSDHVSLTLPRHCDLVAREIAERKIALLALDPLMSVIDHQVDIYNDRDMRTVLEPLGKIADETHCMVVGLAHFNKSNSDDALTLVTGSRAFTAVVRAVLAIARDPEANDGAAVVTQVKNSYGGNDLPNLTYVIQSATVETDEGPANVGRLHFTGETDRSVRDILADASGTGEPTARAEAVEWLREHLASGPQRTRDVESAAKNLHGFSQRTLYRARKQLGVVAEQMDTGRQGRNEWWLSLPGEPANDDQD